LARELRSIHQERIPLPTLALAIVALSENDLDRQVESFNTNLSALCGTARKVETTLGFDVLQLAEWPESEVTTFLTAGLCGFLVQNSRRQGRMGQELALTVASSFSSLAVPALLEFAADTMLERRQAYEDGELLGPVPLDELLGEDRIRLNTIYFREGVWLPDEIKNFYRVVPVSIIELLLLSEPEAAFAVRDAEGFEAAVKAGQIESLDYFR
jgi:hypothetical protein